ncbi:MAG: methyltransferase [Dehalococcoidales bacterium]|nr:methyltransferase [Dehalococcoidales bacterium]
MPQNTDAYYHKTIAFNFWKRSLRFHTSQQLFSAYDIDAGTRFLLRTIMEAAYPPPQRILDAGCGYGPLGLTLKSLRPDALVHLFDRDALAVDYAKQNTALNELNGVLAHRSLGVGVEVYGSLGYDDVPRNDFDVIVCNVPDHAGEAVITYLLQDARHYLAPGGIVAIVVVTPLEALVDKILAETPGAAVTLKRSQSRHVVYHYRFTTAISPPSQSSLERAIYHRKDVAMRFEKLDYQMQTANTLPEFDSLNYGTELLLHALGEVGSKDFKNAAVLNPGQGHAAVALWKILKPGAVTLVDRDLLALRYAQRNLILNGCSLNNISLLHQAGISLEGQFDLFIGSLREGESREVHFHALDHITEHLAPKGVIILASASTPITRLADYLETKKILRVKSRERRRGYSLLVIAHI